MVVADTPAVTAVRTWLAQRSDVTMLPPEALAPDVCFQGDLGTLRGKEAYTAAASRWHADAVDLLQYKTTLIKVASISEDEVVVRWRAEWEPATLQWAPALAAALRWRIERFDVDPGVISTFRWRDVFRLFSTAFATGVLRRAKCGCNPMYWRLQPHVSEAATPRVGGCSRTCAGCSPMYTCRLPASAIEARSSMSLRQGVCVRHSEALDLVATATSGRLLNRDPKPKPKPDPNPNPDLNPNPTSGRLLNRRAAQDVAEFLDVARRPDAIAPEEWAATVRARVLAGVPGAGVLDVEPMDPEDGGREPAVALAAFALATGVAAVAVAGYLSGEATGVSFGDNANSAICDEMMASIGSTRSQDYSQCVSDLFSG